MKEEDDEVDTSVATKQPLIAAQVEFAAIGSTDQPFPNSELAFIRQAMATLESSPVENVSAIS